MLRFGVSAQIKQDWIFDRLRLDFDQLRLKECRLTKRDTAEGMLTFIAGKSFGVATLQ